ncbi:MAG: ACT domain-containing protein [Candidatus Lokiarchaeota archaeon]|nr:ACT domain-containing protein [Candidatus Lokiarchaeota archaeon]
MKETEILKLDKRGRIVIPRIMRKSLGLTENTQLLAISDSEVKEIRIIPLQLAEDRVYIKIKINMPDTPGSLARLTNVFGELGLSLVYLESIIVKKGYLAETNIIAPSPTDISLEELKNILLDKGEAKDVFIIEGKSLMISEED